MTGQIASVAIRQERDVVLARRRARQIGAVLGFDRQDQTRIATATSELARNAYQYAGGGEIAYRIDLNADGQALTIEVADTGPGIGNLGAVLDGRYRSTTGMGIGIVGVRRLMDRFEIETTPDHGTVVVVAKLLPPGTPTCDAAGVGAAVARLGGDDPFAEMQQQNQDLIHAVEEVERREQQLAETNRGILALYAELEERAQAVRVLSEVADGIALVARDGTIHQWNRAAALIVGRTVDQVLGKKAVDVVPGWATFAARIPVTDAATGDTATDVVPIEIDGRVLWLSGAGVALPEGTVYVFRNVTKDRTLEHMRNELIATVSHELRTPLSSVSGAALTLQRTDVELSAEVRESLLSVIVTECARLARIADGILISSQIQAGELAVAVEGSDLGLIALTVIEAARAGLSEPREIRLSVADGMPLVECDPTRVAQVILNLVDNAVKYSPGGGVISVDVGHEAGRARCCVRDDGLGVAAEEHERIFERFYRLDPDLRQTITGTGLGLYISRELVRLMGGTIEVRSELGRGATFVVDLPLFAETDARNPEFADRLRPAAN